jgi:alkaline phosphatase
LAFAQPGNPHARLPFALAALLTACASAPGTQPAAAAAARPHAIDVPQVQHPDGETAAWWYRAGAARAAGNGAMEGRARNVIIFLGDGMSLPTVAAARILAGQRAGQPGEETLLAFEQFPNTALSRTYNTDYQTPDSAGTMTAIATGVKTRLGVIGIGPGNARGRLRRGRGQHAAQHHRTRRIRRPVDGVVTTTRLTHATPASVFAHGPDRNWEDDSYLPPAKAAAGCRDLAAQFLDFGFGDGIDIALAGGRAKFTPNTLADAVDPALKGLRKDGRNLVAEWQAKFPNGSYVWNAAQLAQAERCTARARVVRAAAPVVHRGSQARDGGADARRDDARRDRALAAQREGLRAACRRRPHRSRAPRRQCAPRAGRNDRIFRCGGAPRTKRPATTTR